MPESTKSRVVFAMLANTLRPVMNILLRKQWDGMENLPGTPGSLPAQIM
ncbi:hypothetical protein GCM10017708_37850 [Arthrobacter citreus]